MKLKRRILSILIVMAMSLLACSQLTQLVPPTATPQPTITPTPLPPTTGSLQGKLVEAVLGAEEPQPRPPLSNTLVMLCADYHEQMCTTHSSLTTYTDQSGAFSFPALEPGVYAILYNPFLISDGQEYLSHFDGRQIEFSDVSHFTDSITDGGTHFSISGAPGSGVEVVIGNDGNLNFGAPNGGSAIFTSDFTLIAEYVENGIPATVEIELGKASTISLDSHATLNMGEITLEPAGQRISLPGVQPEPAAAAPATQAAASPQAAPTQAAVTASEGTVSISDTFDDNHNQWGLVDEQQNWGHVRTEIVDGVLRASGTMDGGMFYNVFPNIENHTDATVSVDVKNISAASAETEYGLALYAQGEYEHLLFTITDLGTYTIMGYFGDYEFYALDVSSDAIRRGETNTLRVDMQGDAFTFYINQVQVANAQIKALPADGQSGVFVDWIDMPGQDQIIEFDNFSVVVP